MSLNISFKKIRPSFLLVGIFLLMGTAACTESTINRTNPPVSQASPDTRISDPDDWTGGGTGDGGGGQGIQCGDKLMMRDIYEAKINHKRTMEIEKLGPAGTDTVDDASLEFLIGALKKTYGIAILGYEFKKLEMWQDFAKSIAFVPDSASLFPSRDANSPLALPKDCKIVQIAYWDESSGLDSDGTLYVDKASWMKLDQFNKVGLLAHEYFFRLARAAGFKNSDYARFKVGQLLSKEGIPPMFEKWKPSSDPRVSEWLPESRKGFKACMGTNDANVRDGITFFQYDQGDGQQAIVLSNLAVGPYILPPLRWFNMGYNSTWPDLRTKGINVVTDLLFRSSATEQDRLSSQETPTSAMLDRRSGTDGIVTIPFSTNNEQGVFKILNPFEHADLDKKELKSKDNLVQIISAGIENVLRKAFGEETQANSQMRLAAMAVLNAEINSAIAEGVVPTGFPKWTAALQSIEATTKVFGDEVRGRIYNTYPMFLYRVKISAYSKKDIQDVLGASGFVHPEQERELVAVTIADKSVDFNVFCKNFDDLYQDIIKGNRPF